MRDGDEAHLDVIDVEPAAREVPPRRRPVGGRRHPQRVRQVSLAVAAVVIVVGGFAAAGLLGESLPSSSPNALASAEACAPIASDSPAPAFRLAGAPGDDVGTRGLPGVPDPQFGESDPAWQLPGPELSLTVPTARELRLILATGVCAAEIEIEAAPAVVGVDPDPGDRWYFLRKTLDPASHEFAFLFPSEGDWGLRIVVRYWAETAASERLVEIYFRVRIGDAPFATATATPTPAAAPIVTPAVSCGPTPATADDIVVTLATEGADRVPGVEPGIEPEDEAPLVAIGLGEAVEIAVGDSACATSWTIDVRTNDRIESIEGVPNIFNDPERAAQNRWLFTPPGAIDAADLVFVARFGPSVVVERVWRVTIRPFEVPTAFIVAADGRRAETYVGCGLTVELANGYTAADSCGSIGYDGRGEPFDVDAYTALTVEVPGWTIVGWSGSCGQVTAVDGVAGFESAGCGLGGFSLESGASPPPVRFVVPPADQVVVLWVTASRNGDRFTAPYFARIDAR